VAGNLVGREGTGFGAADNEVVLVLRDGGTVEIPRAPKRVVAGRIFDELVKLRTAAHATR
jgi:phosphopantothenoylcysteine synthetase/decarboxylase